MTIQKVIFFDMFMHFKPINKKFSRQPMRDQLVLEPTLMPGAQQPPAR
jgi:hypothetical protein